MKRRALLESLAAGLVVGATGVVAGCNSAKKSSNGAARRIVSLTPAITETVLALNAMDQLVAVSDYCTLPAGLSLPRVGSALTPRYEAIASLHPSLILSDDSAGAKRQELSAVAHAEALPWLTLPEVVASIRRLGELVDRKLAGDAIAQRVDMRLSKRPSVDAPRVLLLLGYEPDRPAELWFIKRNSLHGSALMAAGAWNAVNRDVPGLPRLSVEELIALDPDQVFIIPPPKANLEAKKRLLTAFSALAPLRAVKDSRIGVVDGTQSVGPSILELVNALSNLLRRMAEPRPLGGIVE